MQNMPGLHDVLGCMAYPIVTTYQHPCVGICKFAGPTPILVTILTVRFLEVKLGTQKSATGLSPFCLN